MSVIKIDVASVEGYNLHAIHHMGQKWIIGGVPERLKNEYIDMAKDADNIILLTSKPEFCGGLSEVLNINPDVKIYASSAGLRNIKEIVTRDINECLIKDGMEVDWFEFYITPNIHWVDTVMVKFCGDLYSGEMFSQSEDMEAYYRDTLAVNRDFVRSALERLEGEEEIEKIVPAIGDELDDVKGAFDTYRKLTEKEEHTPTAVVLYSSEYGYTKSIAEFVTEKLCEKYSVYLIDAKMAEESEAIEKINECDLLAVGTNTVNRNAPKEIWNIITGLDLINKRGTPYFVFGSFGWAGDGIKLVDKMLSAMALKPVTKPIEVLFKPTDEDFKKLEKAVNKANEYTKSDE